MSPQSTVSVSMADLNSPPRSRPGPHLRPNSPDTESALNIHRNTSDILFSTETITEVVKTIDAKQDKIMERFLELDASMKEELSKVIENTRDGIAESVTTVVDAMDMVEAICTAVRESLSVHKDAIAVLTESSRTHSQALLNVQIGMNSLQMVVQRLVEQQNQ